jgi:hypothetical protein
VVHAYRAVIFVKFLVDVCRALNCITFKQPCRFHPFYTKALRESRGIALLSFQTSALEGVRGQHHAPAACYPGKDPVPIVQEAFSNLVKNTNNKYFIRKYLTRKFSVSARDVNALINS